MGQEINQKGKYAELKMMKKDGICRMQSIQYLGEYHFKYLYKIGKIKINYANSDNKTLVRVH